MNLAQRIVVQTYCGGEFNHPDILNNLDECGDGLFKFLMVELSSEEDCQGVDDAYNRVVSAREQLFEVLLALGGGCDE